MYHVNFYEKRDIVLSQLLKSVPAEGAGIKIKGRKGKVVSVENLHNNIVHVEVETVNIIEGELQNKRR
ncbi:hypothetical protein QA612_20050 [Evansella sp. AB-P1]|uniref:hypothetical protein n=1 Tax=Evansella sp. AB-P1 TaxID=3037653 RepID=UPI00241F6829|nr:hypothetical protein [Evansella sp. AB-P1]MDG5789755.1 hypothetical protein [Evansella sp. AB-P1]